MKYFKTPGGLKIRLNHRYFFYQLTNADRYYTDEEIVDNDTMYNAAANIETMFLIPTMLIQIFTVFALAFHINTPVFCAVSAALYVLGCIWRCAKQDFLLSTTLMFLATVYKALWWLVYIALIVLVFTLNGAYIVVPYICMRALLFVLSMVGNHITVTYTMKKYGMPFNDTEICAFRVFHLLTQSELKLSEYIDLYVSVIQDTEY